MKGKMMLFGLEETIDRPIDITASIDFKKLIGIHPDVYTLYNPDDHTVYRKKGINSKHHANAIIEEYLVSEAEEEGEENQSLVLAPERLRTYDIFHDPETGVGITSLRFNKHRKITYTYYTKSKAKAQALREKLSTSDIMSYGRQQHKIEYHFDIPPACMHFINHVLELKNKRLPKEEQLDLADYINKYSKQRISRKNTNASMPYKMNVCVREHQYAVQGQITTDTYTMSKEKGENGYWLLTFEYELWYTKPTMLFLEYPILIWNTPIDFKYTKCIARPSAYTPAKGRPDNTLFGLYHLGKPYTDMLPYNWQTPITIPEVDDFDNWPKEHIFQDICSFLIQVNDQDRYELLNVKQLPNVSFRPSFLKYILTYPDNIREPRNGLVNILLYRNGVIDFKNPITLHPNGNLVTEFPMQLHATYRVVIRIVKDLDYLHLRALKELDEYIVKENENYLELLNCLQPSEPPRGNPHYKKPMYYVDEFGNIVDEEGYVVYTNGERIVEKICECE